MLKSVSGRSIASLVAAGVVAGLAGFMVSLRPETTAAAEIKAPLHQPLVKGDRLNSRETGASCSLRGWPHYEQSCLFDLKSPADAARTVRVIALF
jgi:hypothetical protein